MRQGKIMLAMMLSLAVTAQLNAVERTLIDFTTYNENITQVIQSNQAIYDQVIAEKPELDIRNFGWPEFAFEPSDWNLENWKVVLNPSSDTKINHKYSETKNAPSKEYGTVLGVRLHFSPWDNAFWGQVATPFYFSPTYMNGQFVSGQETDDSGLKVGLLVNTGQIKNVRSWVYGLNYKYTYGVQVENELSKKIEFGLGSIFHEGWRRISWDNREYLSNPNDWSASKSPLYPFTFPYLKFEKLAFYKPVGYDNPNFIGYVKDVTIDHDFAVVREDGDIDDEAIWHIVANETIRREIAISKLVAEELLLKRKVIKLQQASENATAQQNANGAAAPAADGAAAADPAADANAAAGAAN